MSGPSLLIESAEYDNKYKNYFMKMEGVSRDDGTKKYTNKMVVLENDIYLRLFQCNIVSI